VDLEQASKVQLWMPTRPIYGEGRARRGRNRRRHSSWSTGVMRMARWEGMLRNVGDPSWVWGRGPQQDLRCWPGRESERGVVPGPLLLACFGRGGGEVIGNEPAGTGKIRTLQKKLYLKAKAERGTRCGHEASAGIRRRGFSASLGGFLPRPMKPAGRCGF
jgi:hypothetical protein